MRIAICSAEPYINKIDEDIWLRDSLIQKGCSAEIVAWDSTISWQLYDCAVLRSAWGYQHKLNEFLSWLDMLDMLNIPLFNSTETVRKNIYKNLQIKELLEKNIPFIPTIIVSSNTDICTDQSGIIAAEDSLLNTINSNFENGSLFVMKPVVSASGHNTMLIDTDESSQFRDVLFINEAEAKFKELLEKFSNVGIIIQPYIAEIENGEYAVVYIDGIFRHCALRFPAIFDGVKDAQPMPNPPAEVLELSATVMASFSETPTYARIDIINTATGPILMEVELAEPSLLYRCVSHTTPQNAVDYFADAIIKNMKA